MRRCGHVFRALGGRNFAELKYNDMSSNYATSTSGPGAVIFADLGSGSTLFVKNSTISVIARTVSAAESGCVGGMSGEIKYTTVADNYA